MKLSKKQLILEQTDKKVKVLTPLLNISLPPKGWVYNIRTALNLSLRQLSERLEMSPQAVKDIETREESGTISINTLKDVAEALNMKFVYGFIPFDGSLEAMIEKQAYSVAKEIVLKTSHTMQLEDQKVSDERLQKAIVQKASEIKRELPRDLWD
jgi:predicted DNA-binding mobile mystery protein A